MLFRHDFCLLVSTLIALHHLSSVSARHAGHLAVVPEGAPTPDGAIELPAGMKLPARDVAEATAHARRTGRPVLVPLDESALPPGTQRKFGRSRRRAHAQELESAAAAGGDALTLNPVAEVKHREREKHRQLAAAGGGSGDGVTGDGARPTRQPVDEATKLLGMLPYALAILGFAVIAVICILGRLSKYLSPDSSSYFDKSGNQSSHRTAPKMRGGFGRRY
uniref:Uncharacterized protein n=1 Tax=Cryptomonas curvata TaxID=233186 RepID=A0A7S0N8L0_9CRYP|mmetsp:Transcript_9047/g.19429  ORF Transcript_9047/g.19429 Transcript_9047/m.19429 type:complete len:221 (+) Transcript_9047:144-806(+)